MRFARGLSSRRVTIRAILVSDCGRCVGGRVSLLIASMVMVIAQLALYAFNAPAGISYVVSVGLGITIFVVLHRKRST